MPKIDFRQNLSPRAMFVLATCCLPLFYVAYLIVFVVILAILPAVPWIAYKQRSKKLTRPIQEGADDRS